MARSSAVPLTAWMLLACFSPTVAVQPEPPRQGGYAPADVQLVDREGLAQIRKVGKHDIRGPFGDVTASSPCGPEGSGQSCTETARERLKEAAAKRGANLVVVTRAAMLQSHPPQYAISGELYEITERR